MGVLGAQVLQACSTCLYEHQDASYYRAKEWSWRYT